MFWHLLLQDARDDVGGAQNTGMLGILVKTGTFCFALFCIPDIPYFYIRYHCETYCINYIYFVVLR